ncbi:unannotated protein [freshwater metagenome]|uniref:Unannotated protein n=1 Tax=freshwater metagenome TaxID=449393 RepID=A0A6J7DNV5_9ZZZZ|nr:hypothetical protein [Actinomycetota bacterium]
MSEAAVDTDALSGVHFGVVDVETSGLSTGRHRVLQVAIVTVDASGAVLDTWVSLIRPRSRWFFRLGPRHIHGLSRSALRAAPPAKVVLGELSQRLQGTIFTAHNARFDSAFLGEAARRAGIQLTVTPVLCTLALSRQLDPARAMSHRLPDICTRYGVALDRPHDALEDAMATAAVLPHLLRAHGVTNNDQLALFTTS